ncbi:MAG TPA: PAS domain S-box protein [Thermoanaerobaculia bacterium]|nr:PAS domain S-box protein [Thermoanaerobaculia bacterium]
MPNERTTANLEELALLIDAVADYAIFLLSPVGEIRTWNAGASRIMGYRPDEVLGRHFRQFYGPEDLAARKPERELEVAARDGRIEDEGWRVRKDGSRFWANTIITALKTGSGEIHGFAKVTRDLTRRREGDERLRQSEEIFRLLVSSVKDYAIFMLDPQGRVATWNEGAHRIKGYRPEEIIGKHFSIFYPEETKQTGWPERELEIAREKGSVEDESWRLRKDGSMFWASVVITAVYGDDGTLRGFAKVTRDLTERKRGEEAQQALLDQREARLRAEAEKQRAEASYRAAEEGNRAKDEFLMMLSHELRTPMTSILGWARMLPGLSPDDSVFAQAVAAIARSAQIQARLIDDMLDVSRIVSGKLRLSLENTEPGRLLGAAIETIRPTAEARSITLTESIAPDLGNMVADTTRLQQVFWNLLSNAVKFTPRGGKVTVEARRTGSQLQVSITDTGEGIDTRFLPHVFEPFRQAESTSTRTHGGLGLGLSIVRHLVEAHGGTVAAESAGRGKGSTFTVRLPIRALAVETAEVRNATADADPQLRGANILLVDDDREARDVVRVVLGMAGASVTAVDSVAGALAELENGRPDIVLTDIAMPAVDGYELARQIRRNPSLRGVKIVALSAFTAGKTTSADEDPFDEYLTKPVEPAGLVSTLVRVRAGA